MLRIYTGHVFSPCIYPLNCENIFIKAISETHTEIDLVATHHFIDSVEVYDHEIDSIDSKYIYITAYGNLETILQYGSSGDLRRGDGATIHHSFPFTSKFILNIL